MKLSTKTPRIEVVDALRGFAVMAILLVHNLEHFIFHVYPESSPEWLTILCDIFTACRKVLCHIRSAFRIHFLYPVAQPAVERKRFWLPLFMENDIAGRIRHFECCFLPGRRCPASVCCSQSCTIYRT